MRRVTALLAALAIGGYAAPAPAQDAATDIQFLALDRNLDGGIDRDEAAHFRKRMFQTLNADKDGAITAREWLDATESGAGPSQTAPETPRPFLEADADGDGRVTEQELLAVGNARFDDLDADGDGRIDKAEFQRDRL